MKPIRDDQMLQYIHKTGEMGARSLGRVLNYSLDPQLRKDIHEQQREYSDICRASRAMLRRRGQRPANIHPALDFASAMHLKMEMRKDSSPGGIADMIIHGHRLGLQRSVKQLNNYTGHNDRVRSLAVRLMRTEKSGIDTMKNYL